MKEHILEILRTSFITCQLPGIGENSIDEGVVFDSEKAATEIETHVMKFIIWYARDGQFEHRFKDEGCAYQYWKDNVNK